MLDIPELLLPAGDLRTAILAIDHGADAVYVGLRGFSARAKATNLSIDDMYEAIDYAHEHGAKVFCALNIVLFNEEIETCIEAVARLVAHHIDAFIVQDFGLATLLLSHFPETEVHASTQMAIMNVWGVQAMEELGFDRVVLARETSLEMLKTISEKTSIDLEVFVQGALCVSYSGLCYMSSFQGDRSGNRGQCAQPCRKKYTLLESKDGKILNIKDNYLLSPKDMNLLDDLQQLVALGVRSLKIEGRMKQPEYVALMSDIYRKHLDGYHNGTLISQNERKLDKKKMALVFNREGFSTAYLHGVPGKSMMSYHTPKNTGIVLGGLEKIDKEHCYVYLREPLCTGDGVALYDKNLRPIWGGYLDRIYGEDGEPQKSFEVGSHVFFKHGITDHSVIKQVAHCYKTFDKELSKKLLKPHKVPAVKPAFKGELYLHVHLFCGEYFSVDAVLSRDEDMVFTDSLKWTSDYVVEKANNKPCNEVIENTFRKLENTGYIIADISFEGDDRAFIPMSVATKAKNEIAAYFEELREECELFFDEDAAQEVIPEERIEECLSVLDEIPPQIRIEHQPMITVQVRTYAQAVAALEAGAELLNVFLWCSQESMTDEEIIELNKNADVMCTLPPVIKETAEERYWYKRCKRLIDSGMNKFMVTNLGQIKLLEDLGIEYYAADYHLHVTNDLTAAALSQIGITRQTLSLEIDAMRMKNLSAIGTIPLEIVVYGKIPAMHTRYCPMGSFVGGREEGKPCSKPCRQHTYSMEQNQKIFEIKQDDFCNILIMNDKVYDLLPYLSEIKDLCLDYWRIAGAFLSPDEIRKITHRLITYRAQLFDAIQGRYTPPSLSIHTTQGHFIKGVR